MFYLESHPSSGDYCFRLLKLLFDLSHVESDFVTLSLCIS